MAGTIDQLNFEVILKDESFEQKISKDLKLAEQFNISLSSLLDLQRKVGIGGKGTNATRQAIDQQKLAKATADAAAAQERLNAAQNNTAASAERLAAASANRAAAEQRAVRATAGAVKAQRQMVSSIMETNRVAKTQSRLLGELKTMALGYFSIRGAWQLLQSLVRITGEFELQKVALGSMLGDLNKAEQLVTRIQGLAVQSPFAFKELTSYAKQLAAFSVPANELFETTKMLADVSAGLGVGMDRIVLAYGQIRSAAFLRGQEVRQLTEAGIPILKELADQFSQLEGRAVSAGEVFDKISARLVPFEMVAKVFKDMTSEGGKFYEMQEIQAETLRGKVMNLKDAYEIMMNEIGSANDERLKGWVDGLKNMMTNWERLGRILTGVIATYGTYRAALLAIKALNWGKTLNETIQSYKMLNATLAFLNQKTLTYKDVMTAAGISMNAVWAGVAGLAVGAIAMITKAIIQSRQLDKELAKIRATAESTADKLTDDIDRLVRNLSDATQGTQEYRDIISEINRKYKDYLPNILSEADGYTKVADAADKASAAIRNKAKADAEARARAEIEKDKRNELTNTSSMILSAITGLGEGVSEKMAKDIRASFDAALLEDGAMDDIIKTFGEVYDSYMDGDQFSTLFQQLSAKDNYTAKFYASFITQYARTRDEINKRLEEEREAIDELFDNTYSSKEERLGVERISTWFREQESALKKMTLTQEEYDEELRKLSIEKLEKLAKLYEDMSRPEIAKEYQAQAEALRGVQEGWRGDINATLKGLKLGKNNSFGLWADEYTRSVKYVEDLVKRYKELDNEMKMVKPFDSTTTKNLEKEKEAIEAVAKALGLNLQELMNLKKTGKKKSQEQIDLETQINLVKKLQDAYEKLLPYMDDAQLKSTLKELFPDIEVDVIDSLDLEGELLRLADELEKFNEDAAKKLRGTLGKDVAGTIADSFKAVEQYKKMLDSWLGEDFNLSGKGINFDISKIVSNLNTEYAKIDQKRKKALDLLSKAQMGDEVALAKVREVYGEEVWQKYLANGKQVIEKLAEAERASANQTAKERIRDLAQKYVKEKMFEQNIDLSDFEDKNINQVRTLLGKLKDLATETQGEIDKLNVDGLTEEEKLKLEGFIAALDILQNKIGDTSEELDKKIVGKIASMSEEISGSFAKIGSEISSLGDEIGNEFLSDLGTRMSEFGDFAKELSSGIKDFAEEVKDIDFENTSFKDLSEGAKGGVIGIVATVITAFYGKIKNMILSSYEAQRKLTEATREYEETLLDIRREQYTNIFGTDEMALAAENIQILSEATEQYKKDVEAANKVKFQGFRTEGGFGREGLKKQSVIDMLDTIAEGQGWELYKEDGELNIDAIESHYDSFSDRLTEKQRQLVENLIASGNAMNDAAKQSIDYMSSLFNGVADDIASTMVEAFIKTGDAATDLSDIVSNIAKEMAMDLIKTLYIMPTLEKLEKTYQDIDARTDLSEEQKAEQKISALESALGRIQGKAGQMNNTLGRIERFFGEDEDSATETLADGIKGLTEDTANLLASYLNAIRSDVSQMRVIQALHLPIISQSMPTITEHLAKIQANTYNTAVNTAAMSAKLEDIRNTLDSVMTSDGGASAFRTYGV